MNGGDQIMGSIVFRDRSTQHRWVDAIGGKATVYDMAKQLHTIGPSGGSGVDPSGWTTTVVEVGSGTTEFVQSTTAGVLATITTAANDNDGGNYQLQSDFELASTNRIYMGARLKISDVTQSDLFFGLAVTDTDVLGGVTDGVYAECLDASASLAFVLEKDSTETTDSAVATLADDTWVWIEIVWEGTYARLIVDGVEVSKPTTLDNLPDDVSLRPTLQFLNGAAGAETLDISHFRVISLSE